MFLLDYFPFGIVKVTGNSMLPTLRLGQFLLVSPLPYLFGKPKASDIVVIDHDGLKKVKRLESIMGDQYHVVGDNSKESQDSRHFGSITKNQILAKVVYVF